MDSTIGQRILVKAFIDDLTQTSWF